MRLYYIKKHVLSTNFYENKKEEKRSFLMVKEYGRHEVSIIQLLIFVSVCFVVLWLVFSIFRGLSNISSIRYFFVEAYPFKNIYQMEIFVNVYLSNCLITCLLKKQPLSLRILKKPCLLNWMSFLHSYSRKNIISRKDVRTA